MTRPHRFVPRYLGAHRAVLNAAGVACVRIDYTLGANGPETGTVNCTAADGRSVDRVSVHLRRTIARLLVRAARDRIPGFGNTAAAGGTLTWELADRRADDVFQVAHRFGPRPPAALAN